MSLMSLGSPFSWNNYNILGQFLQLLNVDIKRTNDRGGGGLLRTMWANVTGSVCDS